MHTHLRKRMVHAISVGAERVLPQLTKSVGAYTNFVQRDRNCTPPHAVQSREPVALTHSEQTHFRVRGRVKRPTGTTVALRPPVASPFAA
jgi:hypothetical protein